MVLFRTINPNQIGYLWQISTSVKSGCSAATFRLKAGVLQQILPISQNQALFSLIGTFYGGDDAHLQGRFCHSSGVEALIPLDKRVAPLTSTLTTNNLPSHNHALNCVASGGKSTQSSGRIAGHRIHRHLLKLFHGYRNGQMNGNAISFVGGALPFSTIPPYLCVIFIIALQGIFPSCS